MEVPRKSRGQDSEECCYQVSAVVGIDARGQMVLPKEVRAKMGIKAGDRLALIVHESGGKACCMSLMRANELSRMVSEPMRVIIKEGEI